LQALLEAITFAAATIAADGIDRCIDAGATRFGVFTRFEHQERADRTGDHAAAIFRFARPDRVMLTERMALNSLDQQDHVLTLGRKCATDQRMGRLSGLDPGKGGLDRRDTGALFAHEGARRAGDLVDDGNVAGHQVGKLGQEQCRAQFRRQLFVEQLFAVVALQRFIDNQRIDIDVALAATGRHDHVHAAAGVQIVLETGIVERQTGTEDAEALPIFHLPLVAALGDLLRPVDFRQRMHRIRRETFGIDTNTGGSDRRSEALYAPRCRRPGW
jgi:hypothetical protein